MLVAASSLDLHLHAPGQFHGLLGLDRFDVLPVQGFDPEAGPNPGPHLHAADHFQGHGHDLEVVAGWMCPILAILFMLQAFPPGLPIGTLKITSQERERLLNAV